MQQYNGAGKPSSPNIPWLVDHVYQGFSTESVTETLNLVEYEKDAAGSTVIVELTSRRIFDRKGGKLGSYWGNEENLQYTVDQPAHISGVVLTDGSAAVAVYDSAIDLEKIFESATKARYVLKLTDRAGKAYYGFIGGVAVSSGVYTFTIYNGVAMGTQNWVKTWGTGIAAPYAKVEIYEYSTSIEFADAATFSEELPYSEFATDYDQLKSLADGQYRIDYRRGRMIGRKLNADNTKAITYIGLKAGGETAEVNIAEVGGVAVPTAGADAVSNTRTDVPTSSRISGFNGTTWDRIRAGITTVTATLTGFLNTLPWAIYNAAPTTRTEGQGGPLQADASGNLKVNNVGSGGSAGGGNNTYSTEQGDFTATPTDATFNIVLNVDSIGGVAITEANLANGILKIMDVSLTPDEFKTVSLDKFTWTAATKTIDITSCTGAFTLGTGDVVSLTLTGADKMRDSSTDAQRTSPIRDVSDQYAVSEIVNTTNVATGTYYYGSMDGYEDLSFSGTLIDGAAETTTLTLEVSNVGGTTAADWMQVYFRDDKNNSNVNSMAATNETKYFACSAPGIGSFKEYRYLITTTAATNTVKITSKRKF